MSLRVGVVSDVHMRSEFRERITERLEETAERIRAFGPDLVVVVGDVIEDETADRDRNHVERVGGVLDFDVPVRFLAGNHDVANLTPEQLSETFDNDLWGVERFDGETLVFLDSSAPRLDGPRGEVTDEQLALLEEVTATGKPFTVFVHHPIHYRDLGGSYWWSTCPERAFCGNKTDINRIVDPDLVRGVFNGHIHDNAVCAYRGIEHVTLNAFSKETKDHPVSGTYGLVEIGESVDVTVEIDGRLVRKYGF